MEIKNQIFKKYKIDIKFKNKIKYGLLPKPHFTTKNLSILRDNKEIGVVKNFKINFKGNNFLLSKGIKFTDLIFNGSDFNIHQEDLIFFEELLKTEPSENKIVIKNSNIFFKSDL